MISLQQIRTAQSRIKQSIIQTPVRLSPVLSEHTKTDIFLKLECLQTTGSFKLRGATNALLCLPDEAKKNGVTCVSTGNHGRGLAFAAKQHNIHAIICMGNLVPENKIKEIKKLGAEVKIIGESQDAAQIEVNRLISEHGMTAVPPFDDPNIIAGQGTIGLEIMQQIENLDSVIVPLSGGGLLSGIASAVKNLKPTIQVIGVTMERGCAMHLSLQAGKPIEVQEQPTLADSLGGGIGLDNKFTFNMISKLVDETILVSEAEIAAAIKHCYFSEQLVVEGSGSVGIAAILSNKVKNLGKTAIVVSGQNIDMKMHQQIINDITPDIY